MPTPSPSPTPTVPPSDGTGPTPSEWLDFWSSLIGSLAWPLTVLVILIVFHAELVKLLTALRNRIPSMTSMKLPGGVEAAWTPEAVENLSRVVVESTPSSDAINGDPVAPARPDDDKSVELAHVLPSAGVINAFLSVERAVADYLRRLDIPYRFSPIQAVRRLGLPKDLQRALDELRSLRNAAAHGIGDITLDSALDYIDSARRVARAFDAGDYDPQ